MQIWSIVAVVLLAILLGAALPVLFQLHQTLKSSRRLMDRLDKSLKPTLKEFEEVTGRLNRIGRSLEGDLDQLHVLFEAVGSLGKTLNDLKGSMRTATSLGMTVGPVVAAIIRSLTGGHDQADMMPENRENVTPEESENE